MVHASFSFSVSISFVSKDTSCSKRKSSFFYWCFRLQSCGWVGNESATICQPCAQDFKAAWLTGAEGGLAGLCQALHISRSTLLRVVPLSSENMRSHNWILMLSGYFHNFRHLIIWSGLYFLSVNSCF